MTRAEDGFPQRLGAAASNWFSAPLPVARRPADSEHGCEIETIGVRGEPCASGEVIRHFLLQSNQRLTKMYRLPPQ